jgi:hypothetical protein
METDAAFEEALDKFSLEVGALSGAMLLLKAHLHIETAIIVALSRLFPNAAALPKRFRYDDRITLLEAFGARPEFLRPYRKLGSFRNSLAHQLEFEFDDRKMEEFFSEFQGLQRDIWQQSILRHTPPAGGELGNTDKFKLAIVSLWTAAYALPGHLTHSAQ